MDSAYRKNLLKYNDGGWYASLKTPKRYKIENVSNI